ncbi:BTB/POZ-like domain containing protein [Pseudohyphozyma bogoriensis]|nr:BTB/POZ-like domain containing protein [Pseudohyphozyma bogoriensis]
MNSAGVRTRIVLLFFLNGKAEKSLSLTLDRIITMSPERMTSRSTVAHWHSSISHHANDTRFFFPKTGRELWANSTILKDAAPYYKTLFETLLSLPQTQSVGVASPYSESLTSQDSDEEDPTTPASASVDVDCSSRIFNIYITNHEYRTYAATLIYILTEEIQFSALSSLASSATSSRSATTLNAGPPSASPKSVYRLAHFLGLTELQKLAIKSFERQLTVDNVAIELFSDVTRTFGELQDVALDYAVVNWEQVKETAAMKELQEKEVGSSTTQNGGGI